MSLDTTLGRAYLGWRVARERRHLAVIAKRAGAIPWRRDALTVAAVQWDLRPVARAAEWVARLEVVLAEAARGGAALVVFPEDMGLSLLGLLTESRLMAIQEASALDTEAIGARLRAWAPVVLPLYRTVFSRLAAAYGMTVVAGSTLAPAGQAVVNQAHVYLPDGRLGTVQDKLHPLPLERAWGVAAGTSFAPPLGAFRLSTMVCHDASFFETYRMAAAAGAEVVAVPIADPEPAFSLEKSRRGAWARSQETGLLSVVGAGTGTLYGISFTGRAAVYAPLAETPDASGILAESARPDGEGVVLATVNLDRLAAHRAGAPVPRADRVASWLAPRYRRLGAPAAAPDPMGTDSDAVPAVP